MSAIVLLAAAIYSHKASLLALTAFGRYDGCDAAFFLIDGFINHKPLMRTGRHGALKSQRELNLRRRQSR